MDSLVGTEGIDYKEQKVNLKSSALAHEWILKKIDLDQKVKAHKQIKDVLTKPWEKIVILQYINIKKQDKVVGSLIRYCPAMLTMGVVLSLLNHDRLGYKHW